MGSEAEAGEPGSGLSQPVAGAGRDGRLESLPLERLEHEITELAAHIHAATCRWLLLVAELDRREGWAEWGALSCAEWLSWRCGIAPGAAREQVRVGRALGSLPLLRGAFERGELSYSKARAISRVAERSTEAELVELARHASAAQLERVVRGYRRARSAELGVAEEALERRYLDWSWADDGSVVLRGRLPAEQGALFVRAVEAAREALSERPETAHESEPEPEPAVGAGVCAEARGEREGAPQARADALALMAETLLSGGAVALSGGDRHQLVVHVDRAALSAAGGEGRCALADGPALPPASARRLGCEASVVEITERAGRPLSVGRKTRTVPTPLRRALESRDEGCRFPGCQRRRFVDAHHIHHWADGGETKLSNLLLLCRRHHRLVHEGGYRVEPDGPGAVRFRRPDGRLLPAVPPIGRGDPYEPARQNGRRGVAIGPDSCAARSAGDRLDYHLAVGGLCELANRRPPAPAGCTPAAAAQPGPPPRPKSLRKRAPPPPPTSPRKRAPLPRAHPRERGAGTQGVPAARPACCGRPPNADVRQPELDGALDGIPAHTF